MPLPDIVFGFSNVFEILLIKTGIRVFALPPLDKYRHNHYLSAFWIIKPVSDQSFTICPAIPTAPSHGNILLIAVAHKNCCYCGIDPCGVISCV